MAIDGLHGSFPGGCEQRIAELEGEIKALEDEILDCPATNYHTKPVEPAQARLGRKVKT